ncbi:MAG: pyruvate ferredoxin oxidoreductase, partial [Candidatus Heimdallarchaeota archaeon]|nr:pyruvate ferredoxin oxidoreductase [Candidatus Heimdallarchaeota archaeon]
MMFGSLRLRSFRPFPTEEIQKITNLFDTFIVLDRAYSLGSDSPLLTEIRNCFYKNRADKNIIGKVIGMGGADVNYKQIIDLVISIIKETD